MKPVHEFYSQHPDHINYRREHLSGAMDMVCPDCKCNEDTEGKFWRFACKNRVSPGGGCHTKVCAEGDITRRMLGMPPVVKVKHIQLVHEKFTNTCPICGVTIWKGSKHCRKCAAEINRREYNAWRAQQCNASR